MLNPNFIDCFSNKIKIKSNGDWEQDKIERVEDTTEDTLELTNILSSFSDDQSLKDNSNEEIINILRRNDTRDIYKSSPEFYNNTLIIKPKFKRFIPVRSSNPFHKNAFSFRE